MRQSLDAINQAIFKRAAELLLAQDESPERETWIILDELREAGKLDGLTSLLSKGRSFGARVVVGFQDIEGLRAVYGEKEANEMPPDCAATRPSFAWTTPKPPNGPAKPSANLNNTKSRPAARPATTATPRPAQGSWSNATWFSPRNSSACRQPTGATAFRLLSFAADRRLLIHAHPRIPGRDAHAGRPQRAQLYSAAARAAVLETLDARQPAPIKLEDLIASRRRTVHNLRPRTSRQQLPAAARSNGGTPGGTSRPRLALSAVGHFSGQK